mmetsp:Transcript_1994/g.7312  ORF Transcript_1994/g.7312 Transcript_1994/m.7312 type:complete len:280 (-) Transcript_1994:335-1174(-)
MCTRPCFPGRISTKAPNSLTPLTTLSLYTLPTSGSSMEDRSSSFALWTDVPDGPVTLTIPASLSISISVLVDSVMNLMFFPPGPMALPTKRAAIGNVSMRGAFSGSSPRGAGEHAPMRESTLRRPTSAASSACRRMSVVMPSRLTSIWNAVMHVSSPPTLKSMSPSASSLPRMSVRMMVSSPSDSGSRRPIATPATTRFSGTPASSIAKHPAQTDAMEELPFDSVMLLSTRTTYGHDELSGMVGMSARSARLPCPSSRRPGAPMRPTSPTELGGKKYCR